jgi:hypothetical protein
MAQPNEDERRIADLNVLGHIVYFAGQTVRVTADLLDSVIELAANTYRDAEQAFRQGLDPNVDDANIIEEKDKMPTQQTRLKETHSGSNSEA